MAGTSPRPNSGAAPRLFLTGLLVLALFLYPSVVSATEFDGLQEPPPLDFTTEPDLEAPVDFDLDDEPWQTVEEAPEPPTAEGGGTGINASPTLWVLTVVVLLVSASLLRRFARGGAASDR